MELLTAFNKELTPRFLNQMSNEHYLHLMTRMELLFIEMDKAYDRICELEQWRKNQEDDLR